MENQQGLPVLQHGFFCLADEEIYEGYYDPKDLWNGFGKVYLGSREVQRLIDTTHSHPNAEIRFAWNATILVYITDGEEEDIAPTRIRDTDNTGIFLLYNLGDIGYCWSQALSTWDWEISDLKSPEDIVRWFKALLFVDGLNFHPDNDFRNYVDGDGEWTYTHEHADMLNNLMQHCSDVCEAAYEDIYLFAIEANKAYCRYFALPVPGEDDDEVVVIADVPKLKALAQHILDMGNDDYLCGHPEWHEIVAEAKAAMQHS